MGYRRMVPDWFGLKRPQGSSGSTALPCAGTPSTGAASGGGCGNTEGRKGAGAGQKDELQGKLGQDKYV